MSDDLKRQIEEALRPLTSERDALRRDLDKLAANYVAQLAKLQRENETLRAQLRDVAERQREACAAVKEEAPDEHVRATLRVEMHVTGTVVVSYLLARKPKSDGALLELQSELLEMARSEALCGFNGGGGTHAVKIGKVEFEPLWPPRA